jgi:nucleoid-associated protein YgaU
VGEGAKRPEDSYMSTALAALSAMDPKKKKVALGIGAGVALGAILYFIFRPGKASAAPGEPGPNPATDRTIAGGDTLSDLAKSLYGQQYLAIMLLDRNRQNTGAVVHLNLIREGQTLKVPTAAAVAALSPAVKDAYKRRWQAYVALGASGWNANVNPASMNAAIGTPTPV